ncbi:hypothetical protein RDI58_003184 [Solanum bulbocastanum]
MHNIKIN